MASCPSCGVAVVPGYVKCPKCGNQLPAVSRTKSATFGSGGGTAVVAGAGPGSRLNLFIALGAGLAIAIVLVVVLGGEGGSKTASTTTAPTTSSDVEDTPANPVQPAQPDEPAVAPVQPANNDDAQAAAVELERELKRQRLWGTANVFDQRVDIRSGSCDAKDMAPLVDAALPRLQGAGLTKLRCLAQSGAVVFERDI
jgi:hypothetical protein